MPDTHQVYLNLGSDIEPFPNIKRGLFLLREYGSISAVSIPWETLPVGTQGGNFINIAVAFETKISKDNFKVDLAHPIEERLGRVRSADKYAPRPIDIDVMLYDDLIVEPDIWTRPHLAMPLAELLPELINASTQMTLKQTAESLLTLEWAVPHPEQQFLR